MNDIFTVSKPVWIKGQEKERNLRVQFKTIIDCKKESKYSINIASSGMYQLFINGEFVCFGPSRAGRGHFRADIIDISNNIKVGENIVVIEVCGYYSTAFSMLEQDSFVQIEIFKNTESIASHKDFSARINPYYIRKTQRYSFQRPMVESYNYYGDDGFLINKTQGDLEIAETEEKTIIKRRAPYPQYEKINVEGVYSGILESITPTEFTTDRSLMNINDVLTGFKKEELSEIVSDEIRYYKFIHKNDFGKNELNAMEYSIFSFPHNASGIITMEIECLEDATVYILFDELLVDEKRLNWWRGWCMNIMKYKFTKGVHKVQGFDIFTMKYIQVAVASGKIKINHLGMTEYKHPPIKKEFKFENKNLQKIANAAIETFKQNAVDIFMDCPSRERAGWLCDSFFTGRVEHCLTGESPIETDFLENFLMEDVFLNHPEGMFPDCYPADHRNGAFIPNWAMWLVIELEEYAARGGDKSIIEKFQPKIEKLFKYFEKFENENGLLEKLEGWVFVEWSKANELVQDVNYPSNMVYSKALKAAANLYNNESYAIKSEKVKSQVIKESFDGQFFIDNAIREDGKLKLSGERTEVCQYYAFFCDIVKKETHKELFDILVADFGPDRKEKNLWPEIYPANAFIGNYLRLEILMNYGLYDKVLENIEGYFLYMAETTGTLWENMTYNGSCNHGFASHILYWLDKMN